MLVDTIYTYGEDALDYESSVVVGFPEALNNSNVLGTMNFRAVTYSVPEYSIPTYQQSYKGFTVDRWKAGTDTDKAVTISFRVDKYWTVYDALLTWAKACADIPLGTASPDVANLLRGDLSIMQIDHAGSILAPGWVFTGVWPRSIGDVSFDNTSDGEPVTVDVEFRFLTMDRGSDA